MHMVTDVKMGADILEANRKIAEANNERLRAHDIRSFDFLGAIGSGKTLIIEKLIEILNAKGISCGVIAGDVAGNDDYKRFKSHEAQVVNLNTGKECHLDAHLVDHALEKLDLGAMDVLFIENVGNLVCPADFPLGSDKKVTIVSVTEGDDMIRKHPVLMGMSDIIVINKIALVEVMEVNTDVLIKDAHNINPHVPVLLTDARLGDGLEELITALGL